ARRTLFPYTTLFRSHHRQRGVDRLRRDLAAELPESVLVAAVDGGAQHLRVEGGELGQRDLERLLAVLVGELQRLHHRPDELLYRLRVLLDRLRPDVESGVRVRSQLPRSVVDRPSPDPFVGTLPEDRL